MTEEMKQYVVECVQKHARTHKGMAGIAEAVKEDCKQHYGGGDWHCVVGRNYNGSVRRKPGRFISYEVNDHRIMVWRSA